MTSDRKHPADVEKAMEVLRVSRELTQEHDLSTLVGSVLDGMIRMFGAERGFVILEDNEGRKVMVARNFDKGAVPENEYTISQSVARDVLGTGESIISTSIADDATMDRFATIHELRLEAVACLPLKMRGKPFGVVYLDTKKPSAFSEEGDRVFLEALADQAAIAIANARLYRDAIRDGLTGLVSHRYFDLRLGEEVCRAVRYARPLSLLMLDVDHFKLINDLHGHATGNEILRTVASLLRATLRSCDVPVRPADDAQQVGELAGRYGGDEFEILLPDTNRDGAKIVADRLVQAVRTLEFGAEGKVRTTVSIGVCSCPEDGTEREVLARKADEALYNAKRNGRNQVAFPGPAAVAAATGTKAETRTALADPSDVPLSRDALRTVRLIARGMDGGLELAGMLDLVLRLAAEAVGCDRGLVILVREGTSPAPVSTLGLRAEAYGEGSFDMIRGLVDEALASGAPRQVWNAPEDPRWAGEHGTPPAAVRSLMAVPIRMRERVYGVLYLDRAVTRPPLSDEDVNTVYAIAGKIGSRMSPSLTI